MEGRESGAVSASPATNVVESGVVGGGGSSGVAALPQQVMNMAIGMSMERTLGSGGVEGIDKKKRGRPRKYGPDGSMALQLFSPSSSEFSPKRGRGRPPGSGKRQLLAALGEWVAGSAGGNFTPHVMTIVAGEVCKYCFSKYAVWAAKPCFHKILCEVCLQLSYFHRCPTCGRPINLYHGGVGDNPADPWVAGSAGGNFTPHVVTIAAGEDVATRILSFSQKGPRSICILSANGAISNVTLRQPGSSGGTLTYEGRFEILSLSGSFTVTDSGGVRSRTGGISVSLAGPDGRVVGGGVAGLLLAASPIQVVVGSFMPNKDHKKKLNPNPSILSPIPTPGVLTAARPISQANPDDDTCATPTSTLPGQSHGDAENSTGNTQTTNAAAFHTVVWHGLQSTSDQRPSPDINIRLPGE